jgi:transcriptional regulator with XRE-family HTH domain
MEFNEKLRKLRKQKSLTQEELADALFVSRTAISKWESGRGYPSIDSLKTIASFFGISIDELLSGEELITIADKNTKEKAGQLCDIVYGLLDLSVIMFLFLPLFGQKSGEVIQSVSLLSLSEISSWLKIAYIIVIIFTVLTGVLTLSLQSFSNTLWSKNKSILSLTLNALSSLLFIISQQPYAAVLLFIFFIIKVILIIKRQ